MSMFSGRKRSLGGGPNEIQGQVAEARSIQREIRFSKQPRHTQSEGNWDCLWRGRASLRAELSPVSLQPGFVCLLSGLRFQLQFGPWSALSANSTPPWHCAVLAGFGTAGVHPGLTVLLCPLPLLHLSHRET